LGLSFITFIRAGLVTAQHITISRLLPDTCLATQAYWAVNYMKGPIPSAPPFLPIFGFLYLPCLLQIRIHHSLSPISIFTVTQNDDTYLTASTHIIW
jgi:hypothetical protein